MIAVIDDDESILDSTRQLLRSAGHRVSTFDSAESFLDSGLIEKPTCVILDVKMPGIDGLELQRRMNDSDEGVPIVFLSAHDDARTRQRAVQGGAVDFLNKPFEASTLLATIETALSLAATTSATRIVHFGKEDLYRVMVLRQAGYKVQTCSSVAELMHAFESGTLVALICISEGTEPPPSEALMIAKTNCLAPVILFRSTSRTYSDFRFDLEIEPLTPPDRWLSEIERILAATKQLHQLHTIRNDGTRLNRSAMAAPQDS